MTPNAIIWHLTADIKLSAACREIFEAADRGEVKVLIPGIVLVETVYLAEKVRFPNALVTQRLDLVDPPTAGYAVAPLDADVIRSLAAIDRSEVPELPDRVIAATAVNVGVPPLSQRSRRGGASSRRRRSRTRRRAAPLPSASPRTA